eukprot:9103695-Alexandrium_andersonii.AAC.1
MQHVPEEDARNSLRAEHGLVPDVGERRHETHSCTELDHAVLPVRPEPELPRATALVHPRVEGVGGLSLIHI